MPEAEVWRGRWRTMQAMACLCIARLLVAFVPLRFWRGSLGYGQVGEGGGAGGLKQAARYAHQVERAAWRVPFGFKCLPRAMTLSWMLRRKHVPHRVVIAVRPPDMRGGEDALHAWVEAFDTIILGELPGPWHILHRTP